MSISSEASLKHYQLCVPDNLAKNLLLLRDDTRAMGIRLQGGRGSGKSRFSGRVLAFSDVIRGVATVVYDPVGVTISNLLDRISRLPRDFQERSRIWDRIVYVDMSGNGSHVVPFPLYYRQHDESLHKISSRYIDTIRKLDPALATASVQGMNALAHVAIPVGMVLAALGLGITHAQDLLSKPEAWGGRFAEAVRRYPEASSAVDFFQKEYMQWDERTRASRTEAFLVKISRFALDPASRAMYGAARPGINWQEVIEKGCAVLLDFQHVHDVEARRFAILWSFNCLIDYLKQRGPGRKYPPVSVVIDELAAMINTDPATAHVFAADFEDIVQIYSRNYRIWLSVCHQSLAQLPPRIQKVLLSLGTQIIGVVPDIDDALALAKALSPVDPYRVKRYEPVYFSTWGRPEQIDARPIEFRPEEQHYLAAQYFQSLRPFHFAVRPALAEGDFTSGLQEVTIHNFDRNIWVNEELVAQIRTILSRRCGIPVESILAELDSCQTSSALALPASSATMRGYAPDQSHYHIPTYSIADDEEEDVLREEKHV
jgi:hypothetical protein